MDTNIRVRKILLTPAIEEKKSEVYEKLDQWRYLSWRLANDVYSRLYNLTLEALQIQTAQKSSLSEIKSDLIDYRMSLYDYDKKSTKAIPESTYAYNISKEPRYSAIPSMIRSQLTYKVVKQFRNDGRNGLFSGMMSTRNYKLGNMNIYLPRGEQLKQKGVPIIGQFKYLRILNDDDNNFLLQILGGIQFKLVLGKDRSNETAVLNRVLSGAYTLHDSYIKMWKKNKRTRYFLYLHVGMPTEVQVFDRSIAVGVDLGINTPAVAGLNKGYKRLFISGEDDIRRIQLQFIKRRRKAQISMKDSRTGHGRKEKYLQLQKLGDLQYRWANTFTHKVAKQVIDFAIKCNAGVIKLEDLAGYNESHSNNIVLKSWMYRKLQDRISEKAAMEGIEVLFVEAAYTSKTCANCGKIHDIDTSVRYIKCECGNEYDRDYNAAVNIARSENYI